MKNIALILAVTLMLAACSSGTSVSDVPPDNISGAFTGDFESTNGFSDGTLTLTIEDNAGVLTGNVIVAFDANQDVCILNSIITGSRTGFSATISSSTVRFNFSISGDGRTLTGSYVPISAACSNGSGSGSITVTR